MVIVTSLPVPRPIKSLKNEEEYKFVGPLILLMYSLYVIMDSYIYLSMFLTLQLIWLALFTHCLATAMPAILININLIVHIVVTLTAI